MKIALLQLLAGPDTAGNLEAALTQIRAAAANGASLIILPEATSQAFGQGRLDTHAEGLDGAFATGLASLADELAVTIVAGMFRPADKRGKMNRVYNTALITGNGVHKGYDKIHTFDTATYRESDTVKPGTDLVTFVHDGGVVGLATCFDIRFPEQFKQLARLGAQLVVVPTSWEDGPGKLEQWRTLTAARALDAGVFIAAADQPRPGGQQRAGHSEGPTGMGHSVVVSPRGEIYAEADYDPGILYADIDLAEVAAARASLPILSATDHPPA